MQAEKRALDKIYKRRDRYEIPDWQREKVWNTKKKQKLIDTISSRLETAKVLLPKNL
jgi:uncharacterized protein with ParB-like and HNH nuclease domain